MTTARRPTRLSTTWALTRSVLSFAVLVVLYYNLPLARPRNLGDAVTIAIGAVAFVLIAVMQVKAVMRARYPALRAIEALIVVLPLFILVFASMYFVASSNHPGDFSSSLTRTDALYFTVTVFSTVGFGDIVAKSEAMRIVVTIQMVGDLIVVGVLARVILTAAQHRRNALGITPATPVAEESPTPTGVRHADLPADR